MTEDAAFFFTWFFRTFWRFFATWYIPGTAFTPAALFLFIAFIGIAIKFFRLIVYGQHGQVGLGRIINKASRSKGE